MITQEAAIAARIKLLRKSNGISVSDIIKVLDIPKSTYTGWELGRRKPRYESLVKLAEYYGTTVDYILGLSEEKNKETIEVESIINNANLVYEGKQLNKYSVDELIRIFDYILKKE